jgi:hypothetical protein
MTRQTVSIDDIKDRLLAQLDSVVDRYAPPAIGSYSKGGRYFTLNPGRADTRVGSFCVTLSGPDAGRWVDFASHPKGGDILDLIALSLGVSLTDAIKEARAVLGLDTESPELRRQRDAAATRAKADRAAAVEAQKARKLKSQRAAQGLWLSAQEKIAGTPVDHYLRHRSIDLSRIGWQPRALRYHPECLYFRDDEELTDTDTGEVTTRRLPPLRLPAMVAAVTDGTGAHIGTHRTYLAIATNGCWGKLQVPDAKKILGSFWGGSVRLSSGIGPRGGKAARLAECPPGTRIYIAEGIETALSAIILRPDLRVLAGVSLGNMGAVDLPANVAEVVILADADAHPDARATLAGVIEAHAARGRVVRVVQSDVPGEDLNDRLRAALASEQQRQGVA